MHRVDEEGDDPVIGRFLDFVARDLAKRPEAVSDLPPALLDRVRSLTAGIDVDPDDAIEGEVAI